jgi:diguanylate cyclase (GGDEF)-like protein
LTEELTELWKEWKPLLWDVAGRVLRQQQLEDRANEEARKTAEAAAEANKAKDAPPDNPNLPQRSTQVVDPSTRLYNKSFFEENVSVEVERARRYNRNVTLILLSVTPTGKPDEAASEVLAQQAAETLVKSLRRVDVLCRIDVFKFALVLPDTANENVAVVARRVFKYFKGLMGDNPAAHLNLSSASFPKHAPDSPALMEKAEQLLVQAQAAGANKAVLSD